MRALKHTKGSVGLSLQQSGSARAGETSGPLLHRSTFLGRQCQLRVEGKESGLCPGLRWVPTPQSARNHFLRECYIQRPRRDVHFDHVAIFDDCADTSHHECHSPVSSLCKRVSRIIRSGPDIGSAPDLDSLLHDFRERSQHSIYVLISGSMAHQAKPPYLASQGAQSRADFYLVGRAQILADLCVVCPLGYVG